MKLTVSQRSALFIATTTSFMGPFLISSVNVALPSIEAELQLSSSALTWVINAFLLASAVFLLPAGKIADGWGQVRTYRLGIIVFTLSTVCCGLAANGTVLTVFRVVQGIGAAMTITTGTAILVSFFPPGLRGRVLGINVAAVYMGLSMGPFIGGLLTEKWGWQSVFFAAAPLGLIASALSFRWLKDGVVGSGIVNFDFRGSMVYALFLVSFVYGASHLPSLQAWVMMGASLFLFPLFVWTQKRAVDPLFDMARFAQNRLFAYSNLAALINYSATFAVVFLVSLYLQKIKMLTPSQAGSLLVVQPLVQVLVSPVAGALSDSIGARGLASVGMMLNAVGLLLFSTLDGSTSVVSIVLLLVMMGIGFGLFSSPNINTIMGSVKPTQLGLASGTAATMRVIGQMVSMTVAALMFSVYFNGTPVGKVTDQLFLSSVHITFVVLGFLCTLGIGFSLARGNDKRANVMGM